MLLCLTIVIVLNISLFQTHYFSLKREEVLLQFVTSNEFFFLFSGWCSLSNKGKCFLLYMALIRQHWYLFTYVCFSYIRKHWYMFICFECHWLALTYWYVFISFECHWLALTYQYVFTCFQCHWLALTYRYVLTSFQCH